jgi:hypothetical protein
MCINRDEQHKHLYDFISYFIQMLHTMLQEYTANGLFCVNRGSLQPRMAVTRYEISCPRH